jgi:hypothetical protein
MTNTIGTFGKGSSVVSYDLSWQRTLKAQMSHSALGRKCSLALVVLCAITFCVAATAQAQELRTPSLAPAATGITAGPWSIETPKMAPAPQLQVSMVDPQWRPSDSYQPPTVAPGSYHPGEPADNPNAKLGGLGLSPVKQKAKLGFMLPDDSLTPESFFPLVQQSRTIPWQTISADSQPLSNLDGDAVHPLMQINYAGWHLPITLGNSSARANDTRW